MKKFLALLVVFIALSTGAFAASAPAEPANSSAPAAASAAPKAIDEPGFVTSVTNVIGAPHLWGYNFQPRVNELSHRMYNFNTYLNYIISGIVIIVLSLVVYIGFRFHHKRNPVPSKTTHNTLLEIIWTVIPIIIVIAIVIPSIRLLYYVDRTEKADLTVKIVGYQWYWGYELPDQGIAEFESRVIPEDKLKAGERRLLEVDEPLVLPVGKTIRILVTSDPLGVIHAWGVPALAFKRDSVPGRINEGWLRIEEPGVYYGNCYELCGVDHAFMPIKVIGVSEEEFNRWVVSKGGKPAEDKNQLVVPTSTPGKNEADPAATTKPEALKNAANPEKVEQPKDKTMPAGTAPVESQDAKGKQ